MSKETREEYIEYICMWSKWSREALHSKSDKEIIKLYDRYRNM